jgi:predicted O-methyltransferase YrrM/ADP-heptose:LPS heptosyltransferase
MTRHPPFPGCDGGAGCKPGCHFAKLTERPAYSGAPPAAPARPACARLGPPTGELATCIDGCRGVKLRVFACRKHGACTLEKHGEGVAACCRGCDDYRHAEAPAAAGNSIRVNMRAAGVGDGILGLCVVAGIKRANPQRQIVYRAPGAAASFVRLFHGWDMILPNDISDPKDEPGDLQINAGYDVELRTRAAQTRLERYCANVGGAVPEVPGLREPERVRSLGRHYAGAVILAPFSAGSDREYHLQGWLTLERLLLAAGHRVVSIDAHADRLTPFRAEKLVGDARNADVVAGAVLNAACFVGNDSGLSHLAGVLGTPAVVLCGQVQGEKIYGLYPRVRCVQAHWDCTGCWWQAPREERRCLPTCPALGSITPAEIVAALDGATGRTPAPIALPMVAAAVAAATPSVPEPTVHPHHPDERAELYRAYDGGSIEVEHGEFLQGLVRAFKPERILETGTFNGIAARLLAQACRRNGFGRVVSLERDKQHAHDAAFALRDCPEVEVVETDALAWLRAYDGPPFGLVVLDTDVSVRAEELRLLRERGLAIGPVFCHDTSRLRAAGGQADCPEYPTMLDALGLPGLECPYSRGWRLFDLANKRMKDEG